MPSDKPPKIKATEQAYQIIRKDILTGKLAEGERLTETRLSEDPGLSRTPIPEAIGRLTIEGFINRQNGYIIQAIEAQAPNGASSVMSAHVLAGPTRMAERTVKSRSERG